jgi:hypothetical protein
MKHCSGSIILENYRTEIEEYCERNMLSVNKIYNASGCCNDEDEYVWITSDWHQDELENFPMLYYLPSPVLLEIYLENGKLRFVQTEYTYALAADNALTPARIRKSSQANHAPAPQTPYASTGKLALA